MLDRCHLILNKLVMVALLPLLVLSACSLKDPEASVSSNPPISAQTKKSEFITEELDPLDIKGRCSDIEKTEKSVLRENCKKDWTVLVFMAADNELAPYALEDLYEMEAGYKSGNYAGSTKKLDIVAELDMPGEGGIDRLHIEQQKYLYSEDVITQNSFSNVTTARNKILSPVVKRLPESYQPTQSQRLESFLRWGIRQFPADKYVVILWGHGQGWGAQDSTSGGVLFDNAPQKDFVTLPGLRVALENVRKLSLNDKPFDLIVNDACLMQTVEVLSELKDEARFIGGSTQIQNFHGLPYRRLFYSLNRSEYPGVSKSELNNRCAGDQACALAYLIPRLVKATWTGRGLQNQLDQNGRHTFTFSTFEMSYFKNEIQKSFKSLSKSLLRFVSGDNSQERLALIYSAVVEVPRFEGGPAELGHVIAFLEMYVNEYRDLHGNDDTIYFLKSAIADLQKRILYSNVNYFYGAEYLKSSDYPLGSGTRVLSVWLPQTVAEYSIRGAEFKKHSLFYQATPEWSDWLSAVFAP